MRNMTIHKIYPEGFASNCYLLTADGKTAVAIDPAQPRILREAEARGLQVTFVLLTHGHFDHIGGCAALQSAGAKIGCSETEKPLALGKDNLGEAHGAPVPAFSVDFTVRGGEELRLCGIDFRVIATPGHTFAILRRARSLRAIRCLRAAWAERICPRAAAARSCRA